MKARIKTKRPLQYLHQHEQVLLKVNGMSARVDRGIAPLLRELWRLGIYTLASCQADKDADGLAEIVFDRPEGAERFLSLAYKDQKIEFAQILDVPLAGAFLLPKWRAFVEMVCPRKGAHAQANSRG